MNKLRRYSTLDYFCLNIDQALRSVWNQAKTTERPYPAQKEQEPPLTFAQRNYSAALMRVNHAGEICAQALYHGQELASRSLEIKEKMQQAALEEGDHLAWCRTRLIELGSHTSYLNSLWYGGSFIIGFAAGLMGDKWSLGFLAETEQQVVKHLEDHLQRLPVVDQKSHKILQQMQFDESQHRDTAIQAGAAPLPFVIKKLMTVTSKVMVTLAYWF